MRVDKRSPLRAARCARRARVPRAMMRTSSARLSRMMRCFTRLRGRNLPLEESARWCFGGRRPGYPPDARGCRAICRPHARSAPAALRVGCASKSHSQRDRAQRGAVGQAPSRRRCAARPAARVACLAQDVYDVALRGCRTSLHRSLLPLQLKSMSLLCKKTGANRGFDDG
jgi:hypothetical protein